MANTDEQWRGVNDALGALPDRALSDGLAPVLRDAVTFGRAVET